MRAKFVHHSAEWLTGDFEAPASLQKKKVLAVWRLHRNPAAGLIAMKVTRGAGIWDDAGRLVFYLDGAADIVWSTDFRECYSLENVFGPCKGGRHGVRHVLRRREGATFRPIREGELCVPTGGVEYLVIDNAGTNALATWLDQSQWGYVVVDLASLTQSHVNFHHPTASLAPPAFSPDGELVVSVSHFRTGWWTDAIDDYWERPSPGGLRKVGTIAVQRLASTATSHHDVMVPVPAGWIPDRPQAGEWSMIWGPEFVSARAFRFWLPDDSSEILQMPLPERIELDREIGTERKWLD